MKFFKTICFTLALSSATLYSQEEKSSDSTEVVITKLGIGVIAGFNFATVSKGDLNRAPDARTGIYIGVHYEIPIIEDVFSIQPELIYSQQGFEKRYETDEGRKKSIYKIDYINVPIIGRYYVVRGFSLEAGPQISFKMSEQFKRDITDTEELTLNEAKNIDFGIIAGLTFQFESGFFINGRYNRGFSEIITQSKSKNTVIQLGVGYKF